MQLNFAVLLFQIIKINVQLQLLNKIKKNSEIYKILSQELSIL